MKLKLAFVASILFISNYSYGQCKSFTKKKCLPELAPYLSNGQLIAAQLIPGESAEVELNFNKGLSYRLIVCADSYLEGLNYELKDASENSYKTDTLENNKSIIDLKVKQSGPLKLELNVPDKKNATGIIRNGCVTVLVGFKNL
jgi:hypothetical protein